MRIAVVHNLPEGGARRRLTNQMNHLGPEVTEFCLSTATPVRNDATVVEVKLRAERASRLMRPPLRYADLVALVKAWRDVGSRVRASDPDVIYLNPCRYLQAPPFVAAEDVPSVYFCDEVRRIEAEHEVRATRSRWTVPIYFPMYRRQRQLDWNAATSASAVVTNSNYSAEQILRFYKTRATVIRMGVDETLRTGDVGTKVDAGFLLSVGTLLPSKGHHIAIQASAASRSPRPLVIVSPRPNPAGQERLEELAARCHVPLTVRVAVDDAELAALFRTAHATLYLAQREPLGLVSLEAQSCGSPVIVSNEGGLPETIVDGVTGWKVRRDPSAVAEFLDRLDDPKLRAEMSRDAVKHSTLWTWKRSATEVKHVMRETLKNWQGAGG